MLSKGINLSVDDGSGFSQLFGMTSFSPSGTSWTFEDTTNHDSTTPVKTQAPTLRSDGDISIVIDFDPADDTHRLLRTLSSSGDQTHFQITYPGSSIGTFNFNGFVSSFQFDTPINGLLKAKIKITVNDALSDATASITSVAFTDTFAGSYHTGNVLKLTATFDEYVTVTGTPYISLPLTSGTPHVAYVSGSGSNVLLFQYTILVGDAATATHVSVSSPIVLNSGTIKDMAGQAVSLTFSPPVTSTYTVN